MAETIINVQETFKIIPKVDAESTKVELQLHICNSHAIIIGLCAYLQEKELFEELMDWLKEHLKQLEDLKDINDMWGIVGFGNRN